MARRRRWWMEEIEVTVKDDRWADRIGPAVEFIQAHYDKPIRLKDIADAAGLSVGRLAHLFREQAGMTPGQYVTLVRIVHVKRLLRETNSRMLEVCEFTGFAGQSYLCEVFKRAVGTTPEAYRTQWQGCKAALAARWPRRKQKPRAGKARSGDGQDAI